MKFRLNLATQIYINRRMLYLVYGALIGLLLVMLSLNIMSCFLLHGHVGQLESYLETFPAPETLSGDMTQGSNAPLGKVMDEIRFANSILKTRHFHWTQFLDQLEELATDKIKIRSIQPNFGNRTVKLSGLAGNLHDLQKFLQNLAARPAFSDYFLLEQAQTRIGGKGTADSDAVSFTVLVNGVI